MSQSSKPTERGKSPSRIPVFSANLRSKRAAERVTPVANKKDAPSSCQSSTNKSPTVTPKPGGGRGRIGGLRSESSSPKLKSPPVRVAGVGRGGLTGFRKLEMMAKAEVKNNMKSSNKAMKCASPGGVGKVGVVPWADKHLPESLEELFVHKKKVEEVMTWLRRRIDAKKGSKDNLISVFNGPAGSGKTATIHLVGKELDFDVKEWINPMSLTQFRPTDYEGHKDDVQGRGQVDVFIDFLFRTSQYKSLPVKGKTTRKHRLIVVEDIPNNFYRETAQFHEILRNYSKIGEIPLVFIFTDSSSGEHSMYKMFPKNLLMDLAITNISFNPVASTLMTKFLQEICARELIPVDKSTVEEIAATTNGDLRCAVNNLQFSLTKERGENKRAATFRKPPPKKSKKQGGMVSESTEFQQKDNTIHLFRALGKVLYAKRDETVIQNCEMELVNEMEGQRRMHPLIENPDGICEKVEVSADTFVGFLHQNYPPFYGSLDDMRVAAEYLSLSDFMINGWKFDDTGTGRSYRIREVKDQVGMTVAIRGLMHSNNNRVSCGFKPLTKPLVSNLDSLLRESTESTRQALFHLQELQNTLFTETIPFYAKLLANSRNTTNFSGRKEILEKGLFAGKVVRVVNLDEKETVEDEAGSSGGEDTQETISSFIRDDKKVMKNEVLTISDGETNDEEDPEEFLIEEFDD